MRSGEHVGWNILSSLQNCLTCSVSYFRPVPPLLPHLWVINFFPDLEKHWRHTHCHSLRKFCAIPQSAFWKLVLWEHKISASIQILSGMKLWNAATDAKCHRGIVSANLCLLVEFKSFPDVNWGEYNDGNLISFRRNWSKHHLGSLPHY